MCTWELLLQLFPTYHKQISNRIQQSTCQRQTVRCGCERFNNRMTTFMRQTKKEGLVRSGRTNDPSKVSSSVLCLEKLRCSLDSTPT
jgi:hypothetical protein